MEAATVTAPQQVQQLRYVPLDELRRLRLSGTNEEVLREHGLDADSLAERVR